MAVSGDNALSMGVQLIGKPHGALAVLQPTTEFERFGVGPTKSFGRAGAHPR